MWQGQVTPLLSSFSYQALEAATAGGTGATARAAARQLG